MNQIVEAVEPKTSTLQHPEETAYLIKESIAENTLKAYQRALQNLTDWLSGRTLSDALLANYITTLPDNGKPPLRSVKSLPLSSGNYGNPDK